MHNWRRIKAGVCGAILGAAGVANVTPCALAQADLPPVNAPDLANVPDEIKTLDWKSIDLATLTPLEHDRALLLMNHVLDEVAPVRASEASLMSAYIQQQNLGEEFAKGPPPPPGKQLTYTDALKISVAMIRGPMANSTYASQMSDMSADSLAAYQQMYDSTCRRRFSEVDESRQQCRSMWAFLNRKGQVDAYQSWAKLESQNRQLKFELEQQKKKSVEAAADAKQSQENIQQAELRNQNEKLQQALAAAQVQQQQQAAQTQQALTNEQTQSQQQYPQNPDPAYYGGYYGYTAPTYYGANAEWCRNTTYEATNRMETSQRINNWHGAAHGRR